MNIANRKLKEKNFKKEKKEKKIVEKTFAEKASVWIGSESSLYAHTFLFAMSFVSIALGAPTDEVLLILTTIVSLEAIYLSIFIQMTVNRNTESLEEVEEDLDEIQEDIDEIQEDVEDIQEDVDDIQESHEDLAEDIDDIEDSETKRDREIGEKFLKIDKQLELILEEIRRGK
jgi:TolA-binding protein